MEKSKTEDIGVKDMTCKKCEFFSRVEMDDPVVGCCYESKEKVSRHQDAPFCSKKHNRILVDGYSKIATQLIEVLTCKNEAKVDVTKDKIQNLYSELKELFEGKDDEQVKRLKMMRTLMKA